VRSGRAGQYQDQENLLGGVGDRGERVRREDGERDALGEPLVSRLRQRHRRSDDPALQQRQSHTSIDATPDASDPNPLAGFLRDFYVAGRCLNKRLRVALAE
jgi:hypothetical protein